MERGKLIEWKVKPGDRVKRGDVVAVVDTSKAAIDVECWEEGIVYELLLEPEQTVPVGTVIATLLMAGETPAEAERQKKNRPSVASRAGVPPASVPPPAAAMPAPLETARRRISPAARKRAAELGIELPRVTGTGPQGAVTLEDVERAAAARVQPRERTVETRRTIALAMARSKREIPHYYLAEDIPLGRAGDWLSARNEDRPVTERVLMAVLFLKAVARAARKFRELNGFYVNDQFRASEAVHVGVAISLRQGGLIAPAIHDTDQKDLDTLMRELADLVRRARAGSLRSSELSDPTITVTNLGDQGVEAVHGVIYPPQVALVGFGRVRPRPWVEEGAIRALPIVTASLAADHRVSDGHRGALFLAAIGELLQRPGEL